jgi:hypothetical protein
LDITGQVRGKKYLNYLFLNIPETPGEAPDTSKPNWRRLGKATDITFAMNANTQSFDFVEDPSPTTEVENYAPTIDVPLVAYIGDPVFDYVNYLRINQLTGSDTATQLLTVHQSKSGPKANAPNLATLTGVTIAITSFALAGQQLTFTLTQRGTPTQGTAVVVTTGAEAHAKQGVPVFTENSAEPAE